MRLTRALCALIGVLTLSVALPTNTANAAGLYCYIDPQWPHESGHNAGSINSIAKMECNYDPAGSIKLEMELQKRSGNGTWYNIGGTVTTLNSTPTYIRKSTARTCEPGHYRARARGWAAGPNGEAAKWSLWATGQSVYIDCRVSGGGGGSGSW